MSDTVAYICLIVPVLILIAWVSYEWSDSLKGWAFQFAMGILIVASLVTFICGAGHFIIPMLEPAVLESPK